MFTCPDNEIHSLYLDNELPKGLAEDFEAHIASCPKCKAKFESFKKTHDSLKSDASSISLDQKYLDESFERLQLKMRYAKNTAASSTKEKKVFMFPEEVKKYMPAAVAAAAVFAVMLPFSLSNRKAANVQMTVPVAQVQQIKRTNDFSVKPEHMLQTATNVAYPVNLISDSQNILANDSVSNNAIAVDANSTYTLYTFNALAPANTIVITQYKTVNNAATTLLQDDFFTPDFTRPDDQNALQVYMPSYVDISSLNK